VPKATNVTAWALYGLRWDMIRDGEQMSLKMGLEDSHRGWGGDVLRQTVPNTSSGDRKSRSSTVNSLVWLTISDEDKPTNLNVRRLTEFVNEVWKGRHI